jgi:hypothetical protein
MSNNMAQRTSRYMRRFIHFLIKAKQGGKKRERDIGQGRVGLVYVFIILKVPGKARHNN